VVVVGGGPGGYAAALGLAQRGLRVELVEAARVGGTCLHRGCIPTKVLLEAARLRAELQRADALGLQRPAEVGVQWPELQGRQQRVIATLEAGLRQLLAAIQNAPAPRAAAQPSVSVSVPTVQATTGASGRP